MKKSLKSRIGRNKDVENTKSSPAEPNTMLDSRRKLSRSPRPNYTELLFREMTFQIEELNRALRLRGYLSFLDKGELFLVRGSCDEDVEDLQQFGLNMIMLDKKYFPQFLARIELPSGGRIKAICDRIVNSRTVSSGFTGKPNWSERKIEKTAFGAKIPVRLLDPGIALMVKVLPMLRIGSSMSCDGDGDKNPGIWVANEQFLNWAKIVFESLGDLLTKYSLAVKFNKRDSEGWLNCALEFSTVDDDHLKCLESLWRVASDLLDDPERCARIRAMRG